MTIAKTIEAALADLNKFLQLESWFGRENEVVNLYCHRFLLRNDVSGKISPAQCGIEVAVRQLPGEKNKLLVRKDLVIWANDCETVWNPSGEPKNTPIAILEWKVNSVRNCQYDIEWLCRYTEMYPSVIGYSVCANVKKNRGIKFWKIQNGKIVT